MLVEPVPGVRVVDTEQTPLGDPDPLAQPKKAMAAQSGKIRRRFQGFVHPLAVRPQGVGNNHR